MAHYYHLMPAVEGSVEPGAPVVLQVYTDEDGLILQLGPPAYRMADAAMKQLLVEWQEYVASGSPAVVEDMTAFNEFLVAAYGTAYKVTQRY
jgi:hypothetical protein